MSLTGALRGQIDVTPVTEVELGYRGRSTRLLLKLENQNATGSIKDRTAVGLLAALDRTRALTSGTVVVESTSGNLGLGLAWRLRELDCRMIAVVDPKTPEATCEALRSMGAELCLVDDPDDYGGYLFSRLAKVRQLCQDNPSFRWTDQYNNPANPEVHRQTTGPEIAEQAWPGLDAVYVAVSTGGTLAGVSAYLRGIDHNIRIVAVDAVGSRVTSRHSSPRIIPGIGSSLRSSFLQPNSYDRAIRVNAATMVAMCRFFHQSTGVALGGSSGAVVFAVLADHDAGGSIRRPLALCADDGTKYASTIYNDNWLEKAGIANKVASCLNRFHAEGLTFRELAYDRGQK